MTTHFRSARALLLLATLLAVACAGRAGVGLSPIAVPETSEPVEARVDIDSATMIAESALAGLEEGDYDTFTAAWSDAMRAGVGEDVFQDVRQSRPAGASSRSPTCASRAGPVRAPSSTTSSATSSAIAWSTRSRSRRTATR